MTVENMLVISTSHLDAETATMLEDKEYSFGIEEIYIRECGYIMFTRNILNAKSTGYDIPDCLITAATLAKKKDCQIIMFDRDGTLEDDLPQYDW